MRASRALALLVVTIVLFASYGIVGQPNQKAPSPPAHPFPPVNELPEQTALPNPFLRPDGTLVRTIEQWRQQREYLKSLLAHYMYGKMPPRPEQIDIHRTLSRSAFDGIAVEEHYTLSISRNGNSVHLAIALFRPVEERRYPTIIKNCRTLFDPTEREGYELTAQRDLKAATEAVERGYLLCKFRREDLAVDHAESGSSGVFPLYPEYDWGTIAAWAWGHQVVLDALDELRLANMDQVVATGHSRGGQTAIAAGIFDERVDIVAPCTGGYGVCGTLRIRDPDGVRGTIDYIAHLKRYVPHWFSQRYLRFVGQQNRLPFDAHTLVALIAPRPFLNTNAVDDQYNNTLSIEAGIRTGRLVYRWMGLGDRCRLHWRPGKHGQQEEDWEALLDFSDEFLFGRLNNRKFNRWIFSDFAPALSPMPELLDGSPGNR